MVIQRWAGQFNCPTGFIHTTHSHSSIGDAWVPVGCRQLGCMLCWRQRAMAARLSIFRHLVAHKAKFMWLWTTSVRNDFDLAQAFEDLTDVERRFRKADHMRKKRGQNHFGTWIRTWVGVYEVKQHICFSDSYEDCKPDCEWNLSWNVHSHKIVVSDDDFIGPRYRQIINGIEQPFGYHRFNEWWNIAAGTGSAHSDFEGPSESPRGGAAYLTKYLGKKSGIWGSLTPAQAHQYGAPLRGRRFLRRPRGSKPADELSEYSHCCEVRDRETCHYG